MAHPHHPMAATVTFFTSGLLHKFGFDDGDVLFP